MFQILRNIGYTRVMSVGLCARFQHEYFLSIDLLVSPLFAPNPSDSNRVHYERGIFFCILPSKCAILFSNVTIFCFFSIGSDED